jgi:hypothetical protein
VAVLGVHVILNLCLGNDEYAAEMPWYGMKRYQAILRFCLRYLSGGNVGIIEGSDI